MLGHGHINTISDNFAPQLPCILMGVSKRTRLCTFLSPHMNKWELWSRVIRYRINVTAALDYYFVL